jgi:hypothetical protein
MIYKLIISLFFFLLNLFVYSHNDIDRLSKSSNRAIDCKFSHEISNAHITNNRASLTVRIASGYKIKNNHFVGLGLGYTNYRLSKRFGTSNSFNVFPIFIRYNYDLSKNKSTPYIFTDIGANIDFEKNGYMKPPFIRIGIGNKIAVRKNSCFIGLSYMKTSTRDYVNSTIIGQPSQFGSWYKSHIAEITLGILFE